MASNTTTPLLVSTIQWFGDTAVLLCDGKCEKAFGVAERPQVEFDEPNDTALKADHEVGEAPRDNGWYEGGHAKPTDYDDPNRHNKWCARQCERSCIVSEREGKRVELNTFETRVYNQPQKHQNKLD